MLAMMTPYYLMFKSDVPALMLLAALANFTLLMCLSKRPAIVVIRRDRHFRPSNC